MFFNRDKHIREHIQSMKKKKKKKHTAHEEKKLTGKISTTMSLSGIFEAHFVIVYNVQIITWTLHRRLHPCKLNVVSEICVWKKKHNTRIYNVVFHLWILFLFCSFLFLFNWSIHYWYKHMWVVWILWLFTIIFEIETEII